MSALPIEYAVTDKLRPRRAYYGILQSSFALCTPEFHPLKLPSSAFAAIFRSANLFDVGKLANR
jgi:hypothetical protein